MPWEQINAVDKVESAAKQNTTCENAFAENFAKSRQMHARKQVCGDEFATASNILVTH